MRYEPATEEAVELLRKVRADHFPELRNAKICLLFDLKKRSRKGLIVLGQIKKANDLIRILTVNDIDPVEGYDYIISVDKVFWDNSEQEDRVRLLKHELRHGYFDIDSETDPYKIVDHDLTDFYIEVEANRDDPKWRERCASLTSTIYEQKKEDERETKGRKRGRLRK